MIPLPFRAQALAALMMLAAPLAGAPLEPGKPPSRETVLVASRELMEAYPYCALITLDDGGRPTVRTMSPFRPDERFTVWFATHDGSRKAQEIARNPKVTLYYGNHQKAEGYVALHGTASLVTDPAIAKRMHRAYWDQAFPGGSHLVLIKVVPERLEVISYKHGLNNQGPAWAPPSATF